MSAAVKSDLPPSPGPSSSDSPATKAMKITALLGLALASMGLGFISTMTVTAEAAPTGFIAVCYIVHLSVFFVAPSIHPIIFVKFAAATAVVATICGWFVSRTDNGPMAAETARYMYWWCATAYPPLAIGMVWLLAPENRLGSLIGVCYFCNIVLGPVVAGYAFPTMQRLGVLRSLVEAGTWISLTGGLLMAAALPLAFSISGGSIPRLALFEDSPLNRQIFFLGLLTQATNMSFQLERISMVVSPQEVELSDGYVIFFMVLLVAFLAEIKEISPAAISKYLLVIANGALGVGGLLAAISYMLDNLNTPKIEEAAIVAKVAIGILRLTQMCLFGLIYMLTAVFLKTDEVKKTGIYGVARMLFTIQVVAMVLQQVRVALGLGGLLEQNSLPCHFVELGMLSTFIAAFMPSTSLV